MIHVVVMIGGEKNFAVHPVAMMLNELFGRARQSGELLGRIGAVEAFDEPPDLGALADEFTGEDTEPVDRTLVEICFNEEHGRVLWELRIIGNNG